MIPYEDLLDCVLGFKNFGNRAVLGMFDSEGLLAIVTISLRQLTLPTSLKAKPAYCLSQHMMAP